MKLQQSLNTTIKYIYSYRIILIWLAILALLGFTLWQSLKISDPQVDREYLQEQRTKQQKNATDIELSEELREQIHNLEHTPVDTEPEDLGTNDPFHP